MTCREKLKIDHPECIYESTTGGCLRCPHDYRYLERPSYCRANDTTCRKCWDREIPETNVTNDIRLPKFKLFFGGPTCDRHADVFANDWLSENPNIEILNMAYQHADNGQHSICILYRENT